MEKTFVAIAEERPGPAWQAFFRARWPDGKSWYLSEGLDARPTAAEGRAAIAEHMPELMPVYDRVCALAGDDEIAHRALSNWCPPRIIPGCTVSAWTREGGPGLIRNYDFEAHLTTGIIDWTRWLGRRVIAMREAAWGCLDGINEDGLSVALTFGGRRAHGRGFSMCLILRYVLETCRTTDEAIAVLMRIPCAMAQNVVVLDRAGSVSTVFVGADRTPAVSDQAVCTNHQEKVVWPEMAAMSRTVERHASAAALLDDPEIALYTAAQRFLAKPLYAFDSARDFATLYSAVYRPAESSVDYLWPGKTWRQSIAAFEPGTYTHVYAPT
jgi:predicted choloylglycine hydrolase